MDINLRGGYRRTMALAVALIVAVAAAAGAQGVQTGSLSGAARDQDGLVLPGVTVTATSPSLQGERTTVTDANGVYVLRSLPPGRYDVAFAIGGFDEVRLQASIDLGRTTELDVAMRVAGVTEAVTVTGEATAAVTSTQGGANYRATEVDSLATARTLGGIAELAPGLTDNTPNSGQLTIMGGFAYDNVFLVDGVDVNDNLFGDPDNLFIEDAIEETQVLTSGISAEYGRFTGGVVNAITKKGGDTFSGSFRTNLTNPSWTDETPFEKEQGTKRPSDLSKVFEGTVGGPLVKSRLWFFTAARYQDTSTSAPLDVTGIQSTTKTENKRIEGKLTGTVAPNHTVQGSYLWNRTDLIEPSFPFDIDPASEVRPSIPNSLLGANYRGVLTSKAFLEAQFSRKKYRVENQGGVDTSITSSPFISLTPFGLYNAPYFDATDPEDRDNWQVTGSLAYALTTARTGTHDLKGGVEVFQSTNTGGNSQSPSGFVFFTNFQQADGAPVLTPTGKFVPLFRPGVTFVNNWLASRGAELDIRTTSFYVHDRWALAPRLSLDLGVRYERVRSEATGGILGIDTDTIVPRLAATWDPLGDGRWSVQATYGHYAGKYSEAQFSANTNVGNPDLVQSVYIGPAGQGFGFAPGFDPANYLPVDGQFGAANVSFEKGLHSPVNREFTLALGRQFGSRGYGKVQFVNRRLTGAVDDFFDLTTGSASVERDGVVYGPFTNSVYRNSDVAKREFRALVFQGSHRVLPRWSVNGHWTVQLRNNGNFEGEASNQPASPTPLGDFPEIFTPERHYPFGRLAGFQRNKVRLWTIYNVGLGRLGAADVSVLYRYDSGTTFSFVTGGEDELTPTQEALGAAYASLPPNQTVYFGERGMGSFDGAGAVDLALNYSVPIFRSLRPWIKIELRNAFNDKTLIGYNTDVFQDDASARDALGLATGYVKGDSFGRADSATDYPRPRTFQMAVGFRF